MFSLKFRCSVFNENIYLGSLSQKIGLTNSCLYVIVCMLSCEPNANANPTRPTMFKNTQNLYFRTENVHESMKMYFYFEHRK